MSEICILLYTLEHMVKLIFWIVVALLALSFFGISLQNLVEAPTTQNNFFFLFKLVGEGWDYIVTWVTSLGADFRDMIPA